MTLEAWIYAKSTAWGVLDPESMPLSLSAMYQDAVSGFWNQFTGGFTVYNVVGSEDNLNSLIGLLPPVDVARTFAWVQGPGYDSLDVYPTIPTDVLAVMKDHITYDEDGNEIGSTPPTFNTPNWGHVFLGQSQRIFAGEFTSEFTQEFL